MWDSPLFWIWLVIAVISFLAKRNKKQAPPIGAEPDVVEPETKPMTFEDLLREIQANKAPQPVSPEEKKTTVPRAYPYGSDEELPEEAENLERTDYRKRDEDATFDAYEKAKLAAFNRPSLEETMKVEDTEVKFGQFQGYRHEQTLVPAQALVKDLRDPEGLRKAFILGEILNRKY